jgi:hypothetical protein
MRLEVHVHGFLELVEGVSLRQVETALRPLLDELDADHLSDLKSLEPDQPGFVFSDRNYALEMCCTLEVSSDFTHTLESSMLSLGQLVENAAAIEIITYRDDGVDEMQLMFVGPNPEAILEAQRRHMLDDVSALLSRHFKQEAVDEVLTLVGNLFERDQNLVARFHDATQEDLLAFNMPELPGGRHQIH